MYLLRNGYVSKKKDVAEKMRYYYPNTTSALKGDRKYLTDSFVEELNLAFGSIFNTKWILEGDGSMLADIQSDKDKIIQRAIDQISNSDLSNYKIAKDTGITEASIGNYRNGNTKPTLANANIIIDYFNKKELELSDSNLIINTETEYKEAMEKGLKLLPEVDFKFSGGKAELLGSTDAVKRYWYLPDCKDCEAIAQVAGNSMAPAYPSGCWIALKRFSFEKEFPNQIPFGNVFGIVVEDKQTGDYHGHIKILRRYSDPSLAKRFWIARSIDRENHDDFDIDIEQVRGLWIVKQHVVADVIL